MEIKEEIRELIDKLNESQLEKIKKFYDYALKTEVEFQPDRIFHVDVARSIVGENGTNRWKASIVENGNGLREKHEVNSYDGGEFPNSYQAENFGVCAVVGHLVHKEKWKNGKLLIYCDSANSVQTFHNDHLFKVYLNKGKDNIELQKKQKYWLFLARKLAQENNIEVKLEWIRGRDNPADYYSRHDENKLIK